MNQVEHAPDPADVAEVVAVVEQEPDRLVTAAAEALASLLDATVRPFHVGTGEERATEVVRALGAAGVVAAALDAHGDRPLYWDVIARVHVPVLVVPRGSRRPMGRIARVLLPLDGTPGTAARVDRFVRSAVAAGADVVAVHVFDEETIPAFWDSPAHSHTEWTREFLRRNLPRGARLDLRRGRPTDEVLAEAQHRAVDLLMLGWGQDLATGRATTVRHALTEGSVPVLLVGTQDRPGPGTNCEAETGPSSLLHPDPSE